MVTIRTIAPNVPGELHKRVHRILLPSTRSSARAHGMAIPSRSAQFMRAKRLDGTPDSGDQRDTRTRSHTHHEGRTLRTTPTTSTCPNAVDMEENVSSTKWTPRRRTGRRLTRHLLLPGGNVNPFVESSLKREPPRRTRTSLRITNASEILGTRPCLSTALNQVECGGEEHLGLRTPAHRAPGEGSRTATIGRQS